MAEIWYGTHSGSLTKVVGQEDLTLLQVRNNQQLDFLLKILAAGQPLSLQAHPNSAQAQAGFAKENFAGIPLDSPLRNYKDDKHKPEMLVALTEFEALAGFRPLHESKALFKELAENSNPVIASAFQEWAQTLDSGLQEFFVLISHQRGQVSQVTSALAKLNPQDFAQNSAHIGLLKVLEGLYPGDPGIVITLTMNYIQLQPEQAIQVAAGQVHAYLSGLGVEIMASSDNVLRGGLTPKHIDVDELQQVVEFQGVEPKVLLARKLATGLYEYPRAVSEYLLYRIEVASNNLLADIKLTSSAIVLCTSGEVAVSNSLGEREVLKKGQAAYLDQAKFFSFSGSGTAYLATS